MRNNPDTLTRIVLGAAGGLAGTIVIRGLMAAGQKMVPDTAPPLRGDPGKFMVRKVEENLPAQVRERIPEQVENAAAKGLAIGYGLTFGALYAAVRPRGGNALLDGVALGVATWAAGYLGWLPATGLMPPVWRQKPRQSIASAAEHAAYGVAAVGTYDWLRQRV